MRATCPVACDLCKLCANHPQLDAYRRLYAPILRTTDPAAPSGYAGVVPRVVRGRIRHVAFGWDIGDLCLGAYANAISAGEARARWVKQRHKSAV